MGFWKNLSEAPGRDAKERPTPFSQPRVTATAFSGEKPVRLSRQWVLAGEHGSLRASVDRNEN